MPQTTRVRVFIDFWNFQLTLNERVGEIRKAPDLRFEVNWTVLGKWLSARACAAAGVEDFSFDGVNIYASHDPRKEKDKNFHKWATGWLARQPGVHVECRERKPKNPPKCPVCRQRISNCPHCMQSMAGTQEKGVDTLIATDMIRMAWEEGYDMAVLVTSDRDLIPAVEFLRVKGRKVVHAAFPPKGAELSAASWVSFDIAQGIEQVERPMKPQLGK